MRKLTPTETLYLILGKTGIQDLNGELTHAELLNNHAFVVTRDTLHFSGTEFPQAEQLAAKYAGTPRARLRRCGFFG
ncbi:MAG: hypothetical protein KOO63_08100 [Bacteroidales bacterium]|nr:hypothetical protein [Candidatus Latescibacterota bacterium]